MNLDLRIGAPFNQKMRTAKPPSPTPVHMCCHSPFHADADLCGPKSSRPYLNESFVAAHRDSSAGASVKAHPCRFFIPSVTLHQMITISRTERSVGCDAMCAPSPLGFDPTCLTCLGFLGIFEIIHVHVEYEGIVYAHIDSFNG